MREIKGIGPARLKVGLWNPHCVSAAGKRKTVPELLCLIWIDPSWAVRRVHFAALGHDTVNGFNALATLLLRIEMEKGPIQISIRPLRHRKADSSVVQPIKRACLLIADLQALDRGFVFICGRQKSYWSKIGKPLLEKERCRRLWNVLEGRR